MGAWPTDDLTSTHLNSGSDDPALARAELYNLVVKAQAILAAYDDDDGVAPLNGSSYVPTANLGLKFAFGEISDTGTLLKGPSGWTTSHPSTGIYYLNFVGTTAPGDVHYVCFGTPTTKSATQVAHFISAYRFYSNQAHFKVFNSSGTLANWNFHWLVMWHDGGAAAYNFP